MNVPLPRIPTDNLYKFSAILGSILFTVGILILPIVRIPVENKVMDMQAQARYDSLYRRTYHEKLEYFKKYTKLAESIQDVRYQLKIEGKGADTLNDYLNKTEKWNENTFKRAMLFDSLFSPKTDKSPSVPFYMSNYTMIFLLCIALVFSLGGFFLGQFGFRNWYKKLQKPTDLWYENLNKNNDAIDPPLKEPSPETDV